MLAQQYPKAYFIVTGTLGPYSNAHAVDESLDLPYTKNLIKAMSYVLGHYKIQHKWIINIK